MKTAELSPPSASEMKRPCRAQVGMELGRSRSALRAETARRFIFWPSIPGINGRTGLTCRWGACSMSFVSEFSGHSNGVGEAMPKRPPGSSEVSR
jgi:hypothetical protein